MQIYLLGIIVVLVVVTSVIGIRLWCYTKQIRHMKEELKMLEQEDTNYQLSSYCPVGETEEVICSFNRLLVQYKEEAKELKRKNALYKESITGISHDIRTPLTSAKGYIQLLQKDGISEEKRQSYLKVVEQRFDNLTDMLNQLFEYSRAQAGELQFEPEILNAGNLFVETISMFYEEFLKRDCEPKIVIAEKPCKIKADRHAFIRIVGNLVKNALVHGVGDFQFSVLKEKEKCVIRSSNLSCDMERKDVDKLFERFYTTDQSKNRKTTGLGLAIVKQFTEAMGGSVKADLEGNRFTIEIQLPLYEEK